MISLSYIQYSYCHLDEHGAGMTSFASHLGAWHATPLGEDTLILKKVYFSFVFQLWHSIAVCLSSFLTSSAYSHVLLDS